ncbi:multicopper oxidase family protein [Paenibacillus qinlingensis]|uniref:FtsP/CotA-like multicopper oxidase with cupredoxin domain n=1 Tax=Paenibacillus qinlingensis TaxID=1837343 RepID=A0ABU1NYF1_9BACL|nr:multicopper oxidase family protein [Paenibacillus qinlingensis]MDR6552505.1 FtsP/CotA-like multicopper oxidase with cupredoxin domain [Paenibacillus qinlingensis]
MYNASIQTILAASVLFVIFTWIGGVKASRLLYSGSLERLQRKTRKLLFWAWFPILPAGAIAAAIGWLQMNMDPIFWKDRIFLQAPLVVVPLLSIWFVAIPKLLKLRSLTKQSLAEGSTAIEPAMFHRAASLGIIFPYQLTALSAVTSLYFSLVPSVPFQWVETAIPLAILVILAAGLWLRHDLRSKQVRKADNYQAPRIWRRIGTMTGVLIVIAGIGFYLFTFAMNKSILPAEIDMASGTHDYGGGAAGEHAHHDMTAMAGMVSVTYLTGPKEGTPDRRFTLTAQKTTTTLHSGKTVDAWTYNGQIPGPELRMKEGELIEVTLTNKDIDVGVTAHWHGLDVPNAEDGVAGATQNAVMPGETYTYRFRAEQVGSFWYHSHQDSQEAVSKGLFGALIVEPKEAAQVSSTTVTSTQPLKDITVLTHRWKGALAIGANDQLDRQSVAPGTPVRMRLINTDDWVDQVYTLVGTPFQVAAIDGTDLNKPDLLTNTNVMVPTGGRYDLTFIMPDHPVYLHVEGSKNGGILLSPDGQGELPVLPQTVRFDPLIYGSPKETPFNADSQFARDFTLILDNKLGFFNGTFNFLYTLNGKVFPDAPMFMVKEGDLVKTTIINRGNVEHPMHLHGHHVLVLSRNGKPSTGSPWWSDTLDLQPGETYEIAFIANNPGLWMDHCHNLTHAADGMSMHLMYEGITTPFSVGSGTQNHPE